MPSYASQTALVAQWALYKALAIAKFPFSNLLLPTLRFFYLILHHTVVVPIILVFRIYIYGFVYLPLRPFLFLLEIHLDPNDAVEVSLFNLAILLLPQIRFFAVTLVHYFMASVLLGAVVGVGVGLNLSLITAVFSLVKKTPPKIIKRERLRNPPAKTLQSGVAFRKPEKRIKKEESNIGPLDPLPVRPKEEVFVKNEHFESNNAYRPQKALELSPTKSWAPSETRHQYAYEDDDGYNYLASGDDYLASLEDYLVSAGESMEESPGPDSPTPLRLLDKQLVALQTPERILKLEANPEMNTITEDDENEDETTPFSTINSTAGNTLLSHYDSLADTLGTQSTAIDRFETNVKHK